MDSYLSNGKSISDFYDTVFDEDQESEAVYSTDFCDFSGVSSIPGTVPGLVRKIPVNGEDEYAFLGPDEHGFVEKLSRERFLKKLHGDGVVVKKITEAGGGIGYRRRRLRSCNGYLLLSSLLHTKEIRAGTNIKSFKVVGRKVTVETRENGVVALEMIRDKDAVAFKDFLISTKMKDQ